MPEPTTPVTPPAQPDITTTKTVESTPPTTTTTTSTTLKPGWKTTEFWFNLVANIVSALLVTDVLIPGSTAAKITGVIALVLSNLGYTIIRSNAKAKGASGGTTVTTVALFLIGGSLFGGAVLNSGCTEGQRTAALNAAIDCGKSEIKAQVDELVPSFTDNLKNAIDGSGKIDRPTLNSFAAPLKSAATRCGFATAVALLLNPPKGKDGAPQSSPFPVDHADLADAYNGVREGLWGGVELKPAAASQ